VETFKHLLDINEHINLNTQGINLKTALEREFVT